MYAFHVPLPEGAKSAGLDFDYLSPIKPSAGRIEISDAIADLEWNEVVMYPAGYFSRDIPVDTTLKLPSGWKYATALETASNQGDTIRFERTPLNTLVDSPLYAGLYYERVDLSPTPADSVHLDIFADTSGDLNMTPEELDEHKKLAIEADKLYGSHHYKHYDFLLLLSDQVGGVGLEHHQSSEDGQPANYLTGWAGGILDRDLLAHEYTHSWNGKFRRPADLWTPNFDQPMRDDLLWVYEGMTQYWGNVLTARAGMRTMEQTRDIFANVAAGFAASLGRDWRPLVDTTNQPIISQRAPVSWVSYQRPEDYYTEGATDLARRGHQNSRAHPRQQVSGRLLQEVFRGLQRQLPHRPVHSGRRGARSQPGCALRLDEFFPPTGLRPASAGSHGRPYPGRLRAGLYRPPG